MTLGLKANVWGCVNNYLCRCDNILVRSNLKMYLGPWWKTDVLAGKLSEFMAVKCVQSLFSSQPARKQASRLHSGAGYPILWFCIIQNSSISHWLTVQNMSLHGNISLSNCHKPFQLNSVKPHDWDQKCPFGLGTPTELVLVACCFLFGCMTSACLLIEHNIF